MKIKIPNQSQESLVSSNAPSQDLKDMDVLCTYKIKIELKFETLVYQRPVTITKSIATQSELKTYGCSEYSFYKEPKLKGH